MAVNFPSSPSVNDTHSVGNVTWTWNGSSWEASSDALDTIVDAKGDLLVGNSDNTVARLAVGTNGYFLKANSGATNGVEWASIPTINNLDDVGDVNAPSPSDGQFLKYVSASSEWQAADIPTINNLDDVGDVTITTATSGDVLKWNGSAWVNDPVDLGTDTVGDYVASLVAGTGITLSNNSGEGATPTITIGQAVETTSSVTFGDLTVSTSASLPADTSLPERYYNMTTGSTLSLTTHKNYVIEANSSSAFTITVPTNAAQAFPVGTVFTIIRVGTGEITIAGDTGVTVNNSVGARLRVQWSTATLRKRATDTWLLSGDLKV